MSSTPITESYFVIVAVIAATVLTAAILPSIAQVSQVYSQQAQSFQNKADLQLSIVFAYSSAGNTSAIAWVKNTGVSSLPASLINQSDLYFGPTNAYSRIPYNQTSTPHWTYKFVNGNKLSTSLAPGQTMQISITLSYAISTGDYYVEFVTYLGTSSSYTFSV